MSEAAPFRDQSGAFAPLRRPGAADETGAERYTMKSELIETSTATRRIDSASSSAMLS